MKKGREIDITIEKTEFPGNGTAHFEDNKISVKGAIPGERVKIKVTKAKHKKIDGEIIEIIEPSPYRIEKKCPHFGPCGGCLIQELPYSKELQLKKEGVINLFKKSGIDISDVEIEESPKEYEYRNKMEFNFGDIEKGGELCLGMHPKGKGFSVMTTDECCLVDSDFRAILKTTLDYFREKKLPFYRVLSHEGYLRNLVIRKAVNTGEILVNLVTSSQIELDLKEYVNKLLELGLRGSLSGILHTINDSLSDAVIADEMRILYGKGYINENILGLNFKITPFSFFQTNSKGAEKLYSIVRDFLGNYKDKTVFDLYSGTGTIGQIVSQNAKKVIGIEIVEEAVKAANENAKLNKIENCTFIAGDVGKIVDSLSEKPDIIIIDPPRPGISSEAVEKIAVFNPKEILYVSCNPKTLIENLKSFEEKGYYMKKIKLMDMFPHTPHVETVVLMSRKDN